MKTESPFDLVCGWLHRKELLLIKNYFEETDYYRKCLFGKNLQMLGFSLSSDNSKRQLKIDKFDHRGTICVPFEFEDGKLTFKWQEIFLRA